MPIKRRFKPEENELVFHYCNPQTFLSICNGKNLRFTDLLSMNDHMEVRWGLDIWDKAVKRLSPEKYGSLIQNISQVFAELQSANVPIACCLSSNGDVLSQWRAYAQDGEGYSIGFALNELENLQFSTLKVLYDEETQICETVEFVEQFYEAELGFSPSRSPEFFNTAVYLCFDLCALKNPAFKEEQEIRFMHLVPQVPSNKGFRLAEGSGIAFEEEIKSPKVQFMMRPTGPAPFIDFSFSHPKILKPVRKVILGPKCKASTKAVITFLETVGLHDVEVVNSEASYR